MAENLVSSGLKVTIIELSNQILSPLDYEMAAIVEKHLKDNGIDVIKMTQWYSSMNLHIKYI